MTKDSPYYWKVYKKKSGNWKYIGNYAGTTKFNAETAAVWITADKKLKFVKELREEWILHEIQDGEKFK